MRTQTARRLALALGLAMIVLTAYSATVLVVHDEFAGFLAVSLLGGVATALVLAGTNRHRPRPAAADPFARDVFTADIVNIAHVRVAGLGGLGLVLVSVFVTFQYQLVAASVIAGLAGGLVYAGALILYRARRGRPAGTFWPRL
jgi:hypothetical protein